MHCKGHVRLAAFLLWALMTSALLHAVEGNVARDEVQAAPRSYQPGRAEESLGPAVDKMRFERLPCSCQMKECGCCATIQVQRFNFSQRGCLNMSVNPSRLSMMMNVYLNNKSAYQQEISGRNPPPICIPVPQFPLLMLCARLYDVHLEGNNVHACINLEAQLQGVPLLVISFDCIRFGADGFVVEKPQAASSAKPATTTAQPGERRRALLLSPSRATSTA